MRKLSGTATESIPYGAHVLCRDSQVSIADPAIANGIALAAKWWPKAWPKGEYVTAEAIEGIGQRDLHALAAGPIMDPLRLYLPAGKISEEEWQQRMFTDFERAGIAFPK